MSYQTTNKLTQARSSLQFQTMSNFTQSGFSNSLDFDQSSTKQGALSSSYNDFKPQSISQSTIHKSSYDDQSNFNNKSSSNEYPQQGVDNSRFAATYATNINPNINTAQFQTYSGNPQTQGRNSNPNTIQTSEGVNASIQGKRRGKY